MGSLVVLGLVLQTFQGAIANPTFNVSAITVNPATVSIANGPATVTATISVVSTNPINQARLPEPYFFQSGDVQGTRVNGKWSLVSGTATDGTYQATVTIPTGTLTGAWTVGCIGFYDTSGFSSTNGGYSASFKVLSAADKAAADKAAADKAAADKAAADKAAADKAAADKAAADKAAAAKATSVKKTTITCLKGKLIKKVTAVKPKCPAGYKKK